MATAKKAAAKSAKKKTPVAVVHRSDYPAGARVKVTRRTGAVDKGFVTSVDKTTVGAFINVNVGTKDKPKMVSARPASVKGF